MSIVNQINDGIKTAMKAKDPASLRTLRSIKAALLLAATDGTNKEVTDELRSVCMLYGPPGMWESVVHEQAQARKRRKDVLEAEAAKRDKIFYLVSVIAAMLIFGLGTAGLFWGAAILADELK